MYSPEIVMESIDLYYKKFSFNKIAKKLNISRQIVSIWINKYKINFKFVLERFKKISNEIDKNKSIKHINLDVLLFIKKLINIDPFIRRSDIIFHVKNQFNIKLTLNNISKMYKKLNLTFKKPKYFPIKDLNFLEELINKRKKFIEEISKEQIKKIISIDESSFNKSISNVKGLSNKGDRLHVPIKNQVKYKHVSLIMAITSEKVLHHELLDNYINGNIFYDFIKEVIKKLNNETNYIFIFDNYSIHKTKEIELLIKNNKHKIMFIYSSNNNPIENVFGLIKNNYYKLKKTKVNTNNISVSKFNIECIKNAIDLFISSNNLNKLLNIFNRAFTFDYSKINSELKDRLIIT